MGKGRKKLPDEIKEQRGTLQPCRKQDKPDFKPKNELPQTPTFLNNHGKRVFRKLGQYLLDLRLLNEANMIAFVMFCREYGIYWELEEELNSIDKRLHKIFDKEGNERTVTSAKHKLSKESFSNALSIAREFGLTPAAVSKIVMPAKKDNEDTISKLING